MYTGKGQQDNSIIKLFQRLLTGYLHKGHTVFMDRFYSSTAIFYFLWTRKTKVVGACMPNRKELPRQKCCVKKTKRWVCSWAHLLCLKWKDTREVLYLSTNKMTTMWKYSVRMEWKPNQSLMPFWTITSTKLMLTGMAKWFPITQWRENWSGGRSFFQMILMAIVNVYTGVQGGMWNTLGACSLC